jgi:hypothetical protein
MAGRQGQRGALVGTHVGATKLLNRQQLAGVKAQVRRHLVHVVYQRFRYNGVACVEPEPALRYGPPQAKREKMVSEGRGRGQKRVQQ